MVYLMLKKNDYSLFCFGNILRHVPQPLSYKEAAAVSQGVGHVEHVLCVRDFLGWGEGLLASRREWDPRPTG